jgi:hypothetical protein
VLLHVLLLTGGLLPLAAMLAALFAAAWMRQTDGREQLAPVRSVSRD